MRHPIIAVAALALAGCSLLHSPPADASTITVTWTNPTLNTDDSVIPDTGAESLLSARIEYGTCVAGAFGVKAGEFIRTRITGQAMLSTAVQNVPAGLTCVRVLVRNVAGNESTPSNVASTTVQPSTPRPPTAVASQSG